MSNFARLVIVALVLGFASESSGQTPTFVQDINEHAWHHPKSGLVLLDRGAVFSLKDFRGGYNLWFGGLNGANPQKISELEHPAGAINRVGDRAIFAPGAAVVSPIWVTDGTAAGTRYVGTAPGSGPQKSTAVGDHILFWVTRGERNQLWTTDGSPNSLRRITTNSHASELTPRNGKVYFAHEPCNVWQSDGTVEGTEEVFQLDSRFLGPTLDCEVEPGPGEALLVTTSEGIGAAWLTDGQTITSADHLSGSQHSVSDHGVFIRRRRDLWFSNGSPDGTDLIVSLAIDDPSVFATVGSSLVFNYDVREIWTSDGTREGTRRIAEIDGPVTEVFPTEQYVYFRSRDEIWQTDGTSRGTRVVVTLEVDGAPVQPFARTDDGFAFWTNQALSFSSVAASATTTRIWPEEVIVFTEDSFPGKFRVVADEVYFQADAGAAWKTDGTPAGTRRARGLFEDAQFMGELRDSYLFEFEREWIVSDTISGMGRPIPDLRNPAQTEGLFKFDSGVVLDEGQSYEIELYLPVYEPERRALRVSIIEPNEIRTVAIEMVDGAFDRIDALSAFVHDDARLEIVTPECERIMVGRKGVVVRDRGEPCRRAAPVSLGEFELQIERDGLWRIDERGRTLIHSPTNAKMIADGPIVLNARAYFATTGSGESDLWVTDGTARGTSLVRERIIPVDETSSGIRRLGDALVFAGWNEEGDDNALYEYRSRDGISQITPPAGQLGAFVYSQPPHWAPVNQRLVYTGLHTNLGVELFAIDYAYTDEEWQLEDDTMDDDSEPAAGPGVSSSEGCGCKSTDAPEASWLLVFLLVTVLRPFRGNRFSCSR